MSEENSEKLKKIKAPMGLLPRRMHTETRLIEVIAAIARYLESGHLVPQEWFDESAELNKLLLEEEWGTLKLLLEMTE